jgi:hypothetical protein
MRVITFQDRFAADVHFGHKRQTIRANARCRVGDTLSLRHWLGKPRQRGSQQVTLRMAECTEVAPIRIAAGMLGVQVAGRSLSSEERDQLAIDDGFVNWETMYAWFYHHYKLPFYGYIIRWTVAPATDTTSTAADTAAK